MQEQTTQTLQSNNGSKHERYSVADPKPEDIDDITRWQGNNSIQSQTNLQESSEDSPTVTHGVVTNAGNADVQDEFGDFKLFNAAPLMDQRLKTLDHTHNTIEETIAKN